MELDEVKVNVIKDGCEIMLRAVWHGHVLGYADCVLNGKRMLLGNIKVYDNHRVPLPGLLRHLHKVGIPYRRRNLRLVGIGSKLLQAVQAEARKAGVEKVWGTITKSDIANWPYLRNWYERRGFSISAPDADCLDDIANKIVWYVD